MLPERSRLSLALATGINSCPRRYPSHCCLHWWAPPQAGSVRQRRRREALWRHSGRPQPQFLHQQFREGPVRPPDRLLRRWTRCSQNSPNRHFDGVVVLPPRIFSLAQISMDAIIHPFYFLCSISFASLLHVVFATVPGARCAATPRQCHGHGGAILGVFWCFVAPRKVFAAISDEQLYYYY